MSPSTSNCSVTSGVGTILTNGGIAGIWSASTGASNELGGVKVEVCRDLVDRVASLATLEEGISLDETSLAETPKSCQIEKHVVYTLF